MKKSRLVIDSDIEVPARRRGKRGLISGFASEMEPGDSVFFRGAKSAHAKGVGAMRQYFIRRKIEHTVKTDADGVRVWRL